MPQKHIDGVIETVRYSSSGKLDMVRAYERRGPTFGDLILITRDQLLQKLRVGKKFYLGNRIPYMASTFEVFQKISLSGKTGEEFITTDGTQGSKDLIPDAPLF
jgi:hypothetical protein